MGIEILKIKPHEIEAESFRIIETELGQHDFDAEIFTIVRRVIHATGDFSFADTLVFHAAAVKKGVAAIRQGKNILVDVNMAATGISKAILSGWGGKVVCGVADPQVAARAKTENRTRSEVAMETLLDGTVGIVAIGNAPTALLQLMSIIENNPSLTPDLVVGVPVGFVNAAESKELLLEKEYPYITNRGRKGGSPVAAAIVNALLRLA
jgi:precorrin-8X/cobalt-precorrin-8 methylmutase